MSSARIVRGRERYGFMTMKQEGVGMTSVPSATASASFTFRKSSLTTVSMANLNPSKKRPWMADSKPHQGRIAGRNPFYNTQAWIRTSKAYRMAHPFCECRQCKEKGRLLPSHDCDHINPINPYDPFDTQGGAYGEPLDWRNLQALNKTCHNRKSAKERHHANNSDI
jgi:5-methylcytosine-specific restriction endonuclease McrA